MTQTAQMNSASFDPASLMAYTRAPAPDPNAAPAGLPPIPPAHTQVVGDLPPAGTAPQGIDQAQYTEFLAFKASKAAAAKAGAEQTPAPTPTPEVKEPVRITAPETNASVALMDNAAGHDPVMKSMLTVFDHGAKGLDRSRALGNALARGDASLVDVAYIREAGGDQADALIEMAKGIVQHASAAADAVATEILTTSGGQANWDAAAAAFNKSATAGMRAYVSSEMESGNRARILAAAEFVREHAKGSGLITAQGEYIQSGGGDNGAPSGKALSKAEYFEERRKLNPNDRALAQKEEELAARRKRGMLAGL